MYRLEMSLSADGAPEGSELTTCHLTIHGGQQLLTVWQHILKSINLSAWSWPKVNLPGKPAEAPEASTPGAVILYPMDCNWCKHLVQAHPTGDLKQYNKGGHLHVEGF